MKKFIYKIDRILHYIKNAKVLIFFFLIAFGICGIFSISCQNGFKVLNPYENKKPFPYKASLHNHTRYHPDNDHASGLPGQRLRDYRDYETDPPYGIVSISDHSRVSTPWNTVPNENIEGSDAPWGVDGILWLPGNEGVIGNSREGGVYGDLLIVNVSTGQIDEIDWEVVEEPLSANGWLCFSKEMPASVELEFTGTGFKWIASKKPGGSIASIILDGEKAGEVNLYSEEAIYNQEVFYLNGLENGKHSLQLVYHRKGESEQRRIGRINVDKIVVFKDDGSLEEYGARHQSFVYKPKKYKHATYPRGEGRSVEEAFRMLSDDGCFLVLPHPNSRLVTEGEFKGMQLWNSSGYTYDELDMIFGNTEKGIEGLSYLPHALEIGNRGYDFSERTGYKNAEEKWDYLLSQGHRILGIASDDTHGAVTPEGWIVVNTHAATRDKLTIDDVMESLFSGNFYSSQGPGMTIKVNGDKFTVQTDQPALIEFISQGKVVQSEAGVLTATYHIKGNEIYVRGRVTRTDENWREIDGGIGRKRSAWTNPLYVIHN